MATANIDRRIDDIFYRYTMPKLAIQNLGTQTVLINISEVGQALRRSPAYITKFFSYEFGVSVRIDTTRNCYSISGRQDRETLQNALDRFIQHFVLCSKCNNPETELVLDETKKDEVHKICAACGYEGSENMKSERLTKFIAKTLHDAAVKEKRKKK